MKKSHNEILEIDINFVISVIKARWKKIVVLPIILLSASLVYLHFATYKYEVTLQVSPIQGGQTSLSSQLGSFSSLVGLNFGESPGGENYSLYIAGLQSREIAKKISKNDDLLKYFFPHSWDDINQRWHEPTNFQYEIIKFVRALIGTPPIILGAPTPAEVEKFLIKELIISQSKDSSLTSISIVHKNKEAATKLLSLLQTETDNYIRLKELGKAKANLSYLSTKLKKMVVSDYRSTLVEAIAAQEKIVMAANSSLPFVAEPFGEIFSSLHPVSPNPIFFFLISILAGSFIGVLRAIAKEATINSTSKN